MAGPLRRHLPAVARRWVRRRRPALRPHRRRLRHPSSRRRRGRPDGALRHHRGRTHANKRPPPPGMSGGTRTNVLREPASGGSGVRLTAPRKDPQGRQAAFEASPNWAAPWSPKAPQRPLIVSLLILLVHKWGTGVTGEL